jgi:hypothetical protein
MWKQCDKCRRKLRFSEFTSAKDIWCKSCSLSAARMIQKFDEMIKSPTIGLKELDPILDSLVEWYVF